MAAAAPLDFLVPAREILGRLGEGSAALAREADALLEMTAVVMERPPEVVARDAHGEQEILEAVVVLRFLVDSMTGPVRRAVQVDAPDRLARFDEQVGGLVAWGREAAEVLDRRLAVLRSSERILRENDGAYRMLAQ